MCKAVLPSIRGILSLAVIAMTSFPAFSQQDVIANKMNTRPEVTRQLNTVSIPFFSATRWNGYNEIEWSARGDQDTRQFIVEYSSDGIYFQSVGQLMANSTLAGRYTYKHPTFDIRPMLYRLRIEDLNGGYVYSQTILLGGEQGSPVKIYPTIISGNTVNVIAGLPLERVRVVSENGRQVYTQEMAGKAESITVVLPQLSKGVYWMSFTGRGWQATEKFIIP